MYPKKWEKNVKDSWLTTDVSLLCVFSVYWWNDVHSEFESVLSLYYLRFRLNWMAFDFLDLSKAKIMPWKFSEKKWWHLAFLDPRFIWTPNSILVYNTHLNPFSTWETWTINTKWKGWLWMISVHQARFIREVVYFGVGDWNVISRWLQYWEHQFTFTIF